MNRKTVAYAAVLLVSLVVMSTLLHHGVVQGQEPTPTPVPESLIERMTRLAVEDPAALMELLSTQDPAMVGPAFTSVFMQSPTQIANGVIGLARLDAGAIGGILAAGPGQDPAALAALGLHVSVDAWLPDDVPQAGEDRHSPGVWHSLGSGGPVENILGKFKRSIPNAQVAVGEIPTGTLQGLTDLPDGFVAQSFLGLSASGYLESDFIVGHITFFVEKAWLQSNNVHQWSLQILRFDEPKEAWRPVQARRVREDESRVYFNATVAAFSKWVVGGSPAPPAAMFRIENLTFSADSRTNEPTTIQVSVTNLASNEAELNLPLSVNGQVHSIVQDVFGPDEQRQIVFTFVPRNVGEAQVRVDRLASTINVAEGAPLPPTPEPIASAPEVFERGTGLTTGYIVGAVAGVVIALTAVAAFAGSRRKDGS